MDARLLRSMQQFGSIPCVDMDRYLILIVARYVHPGLRVVVRCEEATITYYVAT